MYLLNEGSESNTKKTMVSKRWKCCRKRSTHFRPVRTQPSERFVPDKLCLFVSNILCHFCWVRIVKRVGYELVVESGYETSEPGYESSGYETTGNYHGVLPKLKLKSTLLTSNDILSEHWFGLLSSLTLH